MGSFSRALWRGLVRLVNARPIASAVLPAKLGGKPIPRLGIWRDYRNATRIPELDVREQYFLKKFTHEAVYEGLDTRKCWSHQTIGNRAKFLDKAKEKLPFLARYENAWPAEALTRSHLCRRDRWGQAVSRPEHSTLSESAPSKQDTVVDDISELEGCRIAPTQMQNDTASPSTPQTSHIQVLTTQRSSSAASKNVATVSESEHVEGIAVVRTFLESVVPGMGELTPILVHGGIICEKCLDCLESLPAAEQLEFLSSTESAPNDKA